MQPGLQGKRFKKCESHCGARTWHLLSLGSWGEVSSLEWEIQAVLPTGLEGSPQPCGLGASAYPGLPSRLSAVTVSSAGDQEKEVPHPKSTGEEEPPVREAEVCPGAGAEPLGSSFYRFLLFL